MRLLSLVLVALTLCFSTVVFAQESSDDQSPPAPSRPVLQASDNAPTICDPNQAGFRYVQVRGTGFDAWARQRLLGSVLDAAGTPRANWNSIFVTSAGELTLELNVCADPMLRRPALEAGDYTLVVADQSGATLASTGISLTPPAEPADTDQTAPTLPVTVNVQLTPTPFSYTIPNVQAAATPTPIPVTLLAPPQPTAGPRTGPGSLQQALPPGAPGDLVDGWEVVITGVTPDAYTGIKADIPSASPPASDQRDFMLRVQATYLGQGTGVFSGVRLALRNPTTNQTYTQLANNCGIIPDALPPLVTTQGNSVRGNVCYTVRASDVGSLVAFDNQAAPANQVYFALQ